MGEDTAVLEATDVLEAIAHGFLDELRDRFPAHTISVCKIKHGWIIEGEREVIRPRGFSYTTDIIWYNIIFLPPGVRIDGVHGRIEGLVLPYEDPRLSDLIFNAIYEYTKSW